MAMQNQNQTKPVFDQASQKPIPEFVHLFEREGPQAEIRLEDLTICVPLEKRVLIKEGNIVVKAGERVGFTGPNGSGKSSLFRVIRGLDSEGKGKIRVISPPGKDVFCASQEIRKVAMTLPGLLAYPHGQDKYTHEQYEAVLAEVGLEQIFVHLPWHAVDPENIMRVIDSVFHQDLEPFEGTLSEDAAQSFIEAFRKTFAKRLEMPSPLEAYYTADIHQSFVATVMNKISEKLIKDPQKPHMNLLFPSRAGRRAARAMAEHVKFSMDGWLLQGHRMRLSGGEQQKMVFARMFLQGDESAIFLLDEVTSALKETTAHELYGKLVEKFPQALMVGIVHDPSLLTHFTHHMELGVDKSLTIQKLEQAPEAPAPDVAP
ncbi:MAG: ATP-binding cassette domain-containing protein [Alphaproteobacteria bacterium]|nr:ATP-binding cassette domain-containing protein [Alphaproteobacteria bacterium]